MDLPMINVFSFFGLLLCVCVAETKRIEGHGEYGKRFRMRDPKLKKEGPFFLEFFGGDNGVV